MKIRSGKFGEIPIENRPAFEDYIKELFGAHVESILFYQFNYKRKISDQEIATIANSDMDLLLVKKSLPDAELRKLI